ncbi:uncharacterized protein PFL1_06200 [Pseudozyma flocculosa PF-1]|uniref:Ubiquitin-conjugating enzyme E2 1 n=2 Tax=Pseudozyma flocculosa TaxID=84751 RepID=A0A5C3F844_9BASI|nr:uncharacterized protein PFL1_06200 [Pseudozyma flocculosa PF-1]EPQ26265.1 hypothetical protein PFL1_06200 [Pseudozyma flocculosa PF-1]SPO40226.1 probable UBC1 - E2 ubiquitin-conjugating enzyme [Pseudozyma flocculosa]
MSDARLRRVTKEINDCKNDKSSGVDVVMVDESPYHLIGTFPGPENSPYDGGMFDVDIHISEGYPFQPPKMKFITKVYHPNISSASGAICLDILKDQWSPVLTLKSTLMSLRSLLCSPEPSDPQDAEVAKHYMSDKADFEKTARYWTEIYANGSESARPPETTSAGPKAASAKQEDPALVAGLKLEHVAQFVNMGFERGQVIEVLKKLNYRGANVRNVTDDTVLNELLK